MSYDEFWNKDYKLIESYKWRHERELDYHAQLIFKIYSHMLELTQYQIWSNGDPKKRGKAPKITEKFEPISERGKYLINLEKKKNEEISKYLSEIRGSINDI